MRKNLLLYGPIGCGKSTMIRSALGDQAIEAGGFVTLRAMEGDRLIGFDLAPASVLASVRDMRKIQRFLEFDMEPVCRKEVFLGLGVALLTEAHLKPFAVADEFGGAELLIPEFKEALRKLLHSAVPCIGVLKARASSEKLINRLHLCPEYRTAYDSLLAELQQDPDTEILEISGWPDDIAREKILLWKETYIGKGSNEFCI